jgi:hypothetical protein
MRSSSSGRMGTALFVSAALLIATMGGGCKHQTPEQRAQAKLAKQQQSEAKAQAKAQQKQAKAQAKAQADASKAQEQAAKKQAEADRKAAVQSQKQADAQAKADKKAAEMKAAEDQKNAELAAKDQKKQADAQAKADKKKSAHAAAAPMTADAHRAEDIEPVGPVVTYAAAQAMTKAAHEGYGHHPDDELKVIGYPDFTPENRQRLVDQHAQAQAAQGQSHDATLSDADFDGIELNATGRSNLALALQSVRTDNKLTLYIGTTSGNDEAMGDRAASIERYVKASPWSSVAVTTKNGLNPTHPTSVLPGINALKRMEKEAGGGSTNNTAAGSDTTGGRSRMGGSSSGSTGSSN